MMPKPKHLGSEYATQFKDQSVVSAYRYRPSYPPEVFQILSNLISEKPGTVLDIGCGTGYIARHLIDFVDRIDAVDFSHSMIQQGRQLPYGDHPNLHWICGAVEDVSLDPPYALITAGASLHWMEWSTVFPRFRELLTPRGYIAIIENSPLPPVWKSSLGKIIARYSTNLDYQPYNLIEELEERQLFVKHEEKHIVPMPFVQPIEEYIESFHARNGFSRERMGAENANVFDREVRELVQGFSVHGKIELQIKGHVVWGTPIIGNKA